MRALALARRRHRRRQFLLRWLPSAGWLRGRQLLRDSAWGGDGGLHGQLALGPTSEIDWHASLIVVRLLLVESLAVFGLSVFNGAGWEVVGAGFDQLGDALEVGGLRAAGHASLGLWLLLDVARDLEMASTGVLERLVEALRQAVSTRHLVGLRDLLVAVVLRGRGQLRGMTRLSSSAQNAPRFHLRLR